MGELKILTWHVHGSYLYYLAQIGHTIYLPVKEGRPEGYGGRCGTIPWPANLVEVPAHDVPKLKLDCVITQSRRNYEQDQHEILSSAQRTVPRVHIEHDPPREHPTDTRHYIDDPSTQLVHVTHFNALMWDNNRTPYSVVEHGVVVSEQSLYRGMLPRGLVVVNGMPWRGRRVGADVFVRCREEVPLDLVGMESEAFGGLGEVPPPKLAAFEAQYRFFFNPIRYTSLGLAVCEAMMIGMPIVALATTEMVTVIRDGECGIISTDVNRLIEGMKELIDDPFLARHLGAEARAVARERFSIERFSRDWRALLSEVCGRAAGSRVPTPVKLQTSFQATQ